MPEDALRVNDTAVQPLVKTGGQRGIPQGLLCLGGFLEGLDVGDWRELRLVAALEGSQASMEISRSKEAVQLKEQV